VNRYGARRGEYRRGQALAFSLLFMTSLVGLAAVIADFGLVYIDQNALNASTQAAALAGGYAMAQPGATTASVTSAVTMYSSKNSNAALANSWMVSGYPSMSCMSTLQSTFGLTCYGVSSSNAIVVKQQVTVPLFFPNVLGLGSLTLTSTATAAMKGSSSAPYNVVMIVDTTASMNDSQSSPDCNTTALSCALAGVQVLLQNLSPCPATLTNCGTATNGNVANSVDRVSLLTFPAVLATTAVNDYNCSGSNPTIEPYATPFPSTSTYQIVNFSSDYRTSDGATSLNPNSNIVEAVGGSSGCPGMKAPGGEGTYYAQVIYAAQAYLVAEQAANPGSKNVLILLSDGSANAVCSTSSGGVCTAGPMTGASTTSTTYPSALQQCAQAIAAAQAAWAAGTRVYSVNFGAEATGCTTDTSPTIAPCQTMLQMATYPSGSTSTTYFSDDPSSGVDPSCVAAARPTSSLNQIFQAIAGDLTYAKLIPNNTQ
jgi:hypothetical protein